MRFTRAAKVAAFPLTALILVALVACQGPAGPAGAAGGKGDPGASGTPGTMGDPGTDAPVPLTGRVGDVVIDSLNAGFDDNEATEFMIDLHAPGSGYFNGGEAPFKYMVGVINDSDTTINTPTTVAKDMFGEDGNPFTTAEINEDGMLTLELNPPPTDGMMWSDADYLTGFTIALTAEDANKETATSSLTIKPNRAPQNAIDVLDSAGDGVITSVESSIVIGTMDGVIDIMVDDDENQPRPDGVAMCTTFNSCDLALFQDQDDFTLSVVEDPADHILWDDKGKGKLRVTGVTATEDGEPVVVDVTATDSDGLFSTLRFSVTVDAAPTISEAGAAVQRSVTIMPSDMYSVLGTVATGGNGTQAEHVAAAFEGGGHTVTVVFTTANALIATVGAASGEVTGQAKGTTTITATGTTGEVSDDDDAGLGQFVEIEFTVTVN